MLLNWGSGDLRAQMMLVPKVSEVVLDGQVSMKGVSYPQKTGLN